MDREEDILEEKEDLEFRLGRASDKHSFTQQIKKKIKRERAFQEELSRKFSRQKLDSVSKIEKAILEFKPEPRPINAPLSNEEETKELLDKLRRL